MAHVKLTASLSDELAARLDEEARKRDVPRSALLAEAVAAYFRQVDREAFQSELRAALEEEEMEGREEQESWLRLQRANARSLLAGGGE